MIRGRAVTDTTNPPGQARYLRDVIKKYYDEDRDLIGDLAKALDKPGIPKDHQSGFPKVKVGSQPTVAENLVERLKTAFLSDIEAFRSLEDAGPGYEWQLGKLHAARVYLKILEEST